jgi:hypothetical protein
MFGCVFAHAVKKQTTTGHIPGRRLIVERKSPARSRSLTTPAYARPLRRRDRCRLSPAPVSFASIRPNDEVIETEPAALIRGTLVRRFGVTER